MRVRSLQRMFEGKVFIVNMMESTVRGIWGCPEQREKAVDQTWPVD